MSNRGIFQALETLEMAQKEGGVIAAISPLSKLKQSVSEL